jgi:hypothetical protein
MQSTDAAALMPWQQLVSSFFVRHLKDGGLITQTKDVKSVRSR